MAGGATAPPLRTTGDVPRRTQNASGGRTKIRRLGARHGVSGMKQPCREGLLVSVAGR